MAGDCIAILTPLLLHLAGSELSAVLLTLAVHLSGAGAEAAAAAAGGYTALLGNLLILPAAIWMYRRDRRRCGEQVCGAFHTAEKQKKKQKFCREKQFTEESGRRLWVSGLLCFAAGGILNVGYSAVLNAVHIQDIFSNQVQEQLLSVPWVVQVLGPGILAPVTEELIFRGLTYRRMRRVLAAVPAAVLSSLLFAVYHGNPIQMIYAFPMAIVLAVLYERGKLFVFPVLFHMGANLTAIFLNFLM